MDAKMLNDRVAPITGAGRGIGRAIALGFAKEGASIAGVARTNSELTSLEQEISRLGGRCVPIVADLTDPAAPAKVVDKVMEAFCSAARSKRASVEVGEARKTVSRFCARIA